MDEPLNSHEFSYGLALIAPREGSRSLELPPAIDQLGSRARLALLELLVDEHVRQHEDDPAASLASISSVITRPHSRRIMLRRHLRHAPARV